MGTTECSDSLPSVSVPVLSRQTVSTLASDSTAFMYCNNIPRRDSRTAATANVRLVNSTKPSGISVTMPAVAVATASRKPASWRWSAQISPAASGTIAATISRSSRLIWSSSGDRCAVCSRAAPSSCDA